MNRHLLGLIAAKKGDNRHLFGWIAALIAPAPGSKKIWICIFCFFESVCKTLGIRMCV